MHRPWHIHRHVTGSTVATLLLAAARTAVATALHCCGDQRRLPLSSYMATRGVPRALRGLPVFGGRYAAYRWTLVFWAGYHGRLQDLCTIEVRPERSVQINFIQALFTLRLPSNATLLEA